MQTVSHTIEQTQDLSLLTDGERRYGNILFALEDVVRTGRPGRPRNTLKEGVKVRIKKCGQQAHKPGPKRPKYQTPHNEHPETEQNLDNTDSHENHVEAFNASLRRRLACYRRKTNSYVKVQASLQRRLDLYWLLHNFVRPHFTTKLVPAVAMRIFEKGLSWLDLFQIRYV